ncbi:MAG: EAL domain-containing protein [Pseudomonadota bacterium]|nr:EAL domain-containing protein [Pseudomonadota bacterium]MDP1904341.1 EAL domain-containing protein [Pseudomonadota bacterium]MDP2353468.1 EAL domain-containing protein [Pseudomonadota bacterium]
MSQRNTYTLLLALLLALCAGAALAHHTLTVGVLALRPQAEDQARWLPLADYLGKALPDHQVEVRALDYPSLERALRQHEIDFILTHPTHYLRLRGRNALSGALVTLVERAGTTPLEAIGGTIFTRTDRADINSLQDLSGRVIASCSEACMEGYQLQQEALLDAGLPPLEPARMLFLGLPHDLVVEAVLSGKADVGFARAGVIESMAREGRVDATRLKILNRQDLPGFPYAASTRLYPQWPLAALPQVDAASARRVAAALLRIEPDTPLAWALDIHAFTIPASYAGVEDLAAKLRLPPYDSSPRFTLADVWSRYQIPLLLLFAAAGVILLLTTRLLISRHRLTAARRLSEQQAAALSRSYAHLRTLVETIPDLVWLKDPKGVFLACNPRFERLYNAPEAEIVGKTDDAFVPREQAEFFRAKDREAIAAGKPCLNEEWVTYADNGQQSLLETIKTPMRDAEGELVGVLGIARDITARRADEERLRFFARVVESAGEAFMVTDMRGIIVATNPAFTAITGYSAAEVLGQTPALLKSDRQDAAFYQVMWAALRDQGGWEGEIWDRRKDGTTYPKWLSITTVRDDAGEASHYVAAFTDISERKAVEERIHNLAFYDSLTTLPNRRLLMDRLEHALLTSGRSRQYGALLFLDLDHFKTLNDTQGHATGDQLLVAIGLRLSASVRDMDTVSRLGGDEFVVLIENLGEHEAAAVTQAKSIAEKIHTSLNEPYWLKGMDQGYHSSASIGLTLFRGQETPLDALFKQADMAMYQAKDAGRNAIRFFNPAMQATIEARATMESDLRWGLTHDELRLYYQPQVNHQGDWIGAEALLRWLPPGRAPISPVEFIPLAEETGLILPIGLMVLRVACEQLKAWAAVPAARGLVLAVNVSARQFHQPDFVSGVAEILAATGAEPTRLKLELTESTVLANVEEAIARMESLKALGIGLSLDDFGTGYSSLSHLRRLPVEQIKIDRSFVSDLSGKSSDTAIVRAILAMSGSLGLTVVAEGVETDQQFAYLLQYGCPMFQGYLFGKPMPADEFTRRLEAVGDGAGL